MSLTISFSSRPVLIENQHAGRVVALYTLTALQVAFSITKLKSGETLENVLYITCPARPNAAKARPDAHNPCDC